MSLKEIVSLRHFDCIYCKGKVVDISFGRKQIEKQHKQVACSKCSKKYPYIKFKEKIPFKDKVMILGGWIALVTVVRVLLYTYEPYKWLGSLGALMISVLLVYVLFNMFGPLKPYKKRIMRVMRWWYSRKLQYFFVMIFVLYSVAIAFMEYGYAKYGEALMPLRDRCKALYDGDDKEAAEQCVDEVVTQTMPKDAPALDIATYSVVALDISMDQRNRFLIWMVVYEDAEFLTFLYLVKSGRLFGRQQQEMGMQSIVFSSSRSE